MQVHLSYLSRSGRSSIGSSKASHDPSQWPRSSGIWSDHFAKVANQFLFWGQEWKQKKWNASSFQSPNPIRWPFCFYIPRSVLGTVNQRIVWFSQTAVFNSLEEKGFRSFLLAQSGGWEIIPYVVDFSIIGGSYYYTMNINNYNSLKLVLRISKDFLPCMNFRRNRKHRQY